MVENRLEAAIDVREAGLPVGKISACKEGGDFSNQFPLRQGVMLTGNPVATLDGSAEAVPELFFDRPQGDKTAVRRRVDLVAGRAAGEQIGTTGKSCSRAMGGGKGHRLPGEGHFKQADIDETACIRSGAFEQCGQNRGGGLFPRCIIADRREGNHRRGGGSGQAEHAAHGQIGQVMPRTQATGPGLAEAGQGAVDQAGIELFEMVTPEAEAFQHAGAKGFEQHISPLQQVGKLGALHRVFQVEFDD